jgi:hypothetical protein
MSVTGRDIHRIVGMVGLGALLGAPLPKGDNMAAELAFKSGVIGLGILSSVMLSIVVFSF